MRGVTLYVGTTGTGKTTQALEDMRRQELPRVILDLGGSATLARIPRSAKASPKGQSEEEIRLAPENAEELDAILRSLYERGNVAILVDDMMALPSRELPRICRLWRPRNLRVSITTHHVAGDVGQVIMACNPLIFAYRTTAPRSLEWLQKWHGVDPEELRNLPLGEALELAF